MPREIDETQLRQLLGRLKRLGLSEEPSTVDPTPPTLYGPRSTVDPATWELRELKHSVRWTVYVPQAMKDEIQQRARDRHQPPSVILQELLWQALQESRHGSAP